MLRQTKKMGREKFFKKLQKHLSSGDYTLCYQHMTTKLRIKAPIVQRIYCPITFLAYKETHQTFEIKEWEKAAKALHLDKSFASNVTEASDWDGASPVHNMQEVIELRRLLVASRRLPPFQSRLLWVDKHKWILT